MTVADLIATLETMPAEALVVIDGYEFGWTDPGDVHQRKVVDVQDDDEPSEWSGRYDDPRLYRHGNARPVLEVVVIPR